MRLPPAPWLLLALLLLVTVPPLARPLPTQHALAALALVTDPPTQTVDITITASGADPQAITVTTGTTVRWRNVDSIAHIISADDGSFGPFPLGNLDTATYTFDAAGAYSYTISAVPAAASTGTIVVTGGSAASATPSPTWTASASSTPSATSTSSPTPSATSSPTPTHTPSATATDSPSSTATPTGTGTPTGTPTASSIGTTTSTSSPTSIASNTALPSATATPTQPSCLDTAPVTITSTGFDPQTATISAGACVQWINKAPADIVVDFGPSLTIYVAEDGTSLSPPFPDAGTYPYYMSCCLEEAFGGSIIVIPSPPTASATTTVNATATSTFPTSAAPTATGTQTSGGDTSATPTPTVAADTATATLTDTPASSPSAMPTNTPTPSPMASPRPSDTPTVLPVLYISLSGAVPSPCTLSIPVGSVVTWTDDNPPGGPSYYLQGIGPPPFSIFSMRLDPAGEGISSTSFIFGIEGSYTYSITSTASLTPVQATIMVGGAARPCPTSTGTATASATPSPTSTPTATPTSSPSATPTASATNTPTYTPTPTATPTWTATATSTPTPQASPTATATPPATAGSVPPPATPSGAAGATPTRAASAAESTPPPAPRRTSTPAAAPRQRCLAVVPRRAAGTLAIDGYARHSRTRVDLTVALPIPLSAKHGTLRLRDPAARIALASARIVRVRLACSDLRVDGLGHIGKRTTPFTAEVRAGRHGLTLTASVPAHHYRFSGAFHGQIAVRLTHKSPTTHGTSKRPAKSGRTAGHSGKKATTPGKKR